MTTQRQATTAAATMAQTAPGLDFEVSDEMAEMLATMEAAKGDPRGMSDVERARYVRDLCKLLRLNPLTRPVQFLSLSGREVLYVTRTATDQLAAMHSLNRETLEGPEVRVIEGVKVVYCKVKCTLPTGRFETAVATFLLKSPADDLMKAETKAKRRGTLAILGLGVLAEDEAESIPGGRKVDERPRDFRTPTPPNGTPTALPPGIEGDVIAAARAHRNARADSETQRPSQPPAVVDDNPDAEPPTPDYEVVQPAPVDGPPTLARFYESVATMELPGEAVGLWLRHREVIAAAPKPEREKAWADLAGKTFVVGKMGSIGTAKTWLKRALAEETARRETSGKSDHQAP